MNSVEPGKRSRILIVFRSVGFLRHFGEALEELLRRGHFVEIAYETLSDLPQYAEAQQRLESYSRFRSSTLPRFHRGPRSRYLKRLRSIWDYLRYFHPAFKEMRFLRSRVEADVPNLILRLGRLGLFSWQPFRSLAENAVSYLDQREAVNPELEHFVSLRQPDLLIVSPLIWFASKQTEFVKTARHLGIPSVLCVASWDNLSTKGTIRFVPDHLIVWNQTQVHEAVEFHGVPRSQLVATGAQTFDQWFGRKPSVGRSEFLRELGIAPNKKLAVYLCSSESIGGAEHNFIEMWVRAIRASDDPLVNGLGILIRPHPKNRNQWEGKVIAADAPVWPLDDSGFYGVSGANSLFNTLFHADLIVGLNTTAMIEAAILNKPVLTPRIVDQPQVRQGTNEMYHFRYISSETGGFVRVAETMQEHLRQLKHALLHPEAYRKGAEDFVEHFVRPCGRTKPATLILADTLESLASSGPELPSLRSI